MTISEMLHSIEQSTKEGETEILGKIIMDVIGKNTKDLIAVRTNEFSSALGNTCVYIDPEIARMQSAREVFELDFEVRFAMDPKSGQQTYDYAICLNKEPYRITSDKDPGTIEAKLRREIGILNQLGLNLEYTGQCVPPSQK